MFDTVIDNFNRANESPAAGWTAHNVQGTTSNIKVASNAAAGIGAGWNGAVNNAAGGSLADCEAFATLGTVMNSLLVFARRSTSAAPTGYHIEVKSTGIDLWRAAESTWTQIHANVAVTLTTGDKVGIRCIGSAIEAWYYKSGAWTLACRAYDATYTSGYIGLGMFNTFTADDFGGGAIVAPPPPTYVGMSTVPTGTGAGTGTTTLTVPYPTVAAGDLLVCGVTVKPETATVTVPTGWTAVPNGEAAGGGGTTGLDTGPTRGTTFWKIADGTESGNLTVTLGSSPNACMGYMAVLRPAYPGWAWSINGANGIDTTTGTPFTAAMGTDPGIEAGDLALVFGSIPTDVTTPSQFSAETLTATGLVATVIERAEPETTQGNDLGGVFCTAEVTSGPATTVATFSATAGGTTTNVRGPIILVRTRLVPPAHRKAVGAGAAAQQAAAW